ncbi:MAG: hypothetical protein NVS3B25_21240 [Hymenobacter sp.]
MPFGGLLTTGLIGVASAAPKFFAAYKQNKQADELTKQDTTPAAFKEQMALDRQAANTARLPNQSQQEDRLAQVQAGAVQNARLGAASSSDFLASAGAADARRPQGEQQLGVQGLQYQDGMKKQLRADNTQQAAYQQHDLDTYNRTKAALTQGAAQNFDNGLGTLGSYAAQGLNMGIASGTIKTPAGVANAAAGAGVGLGAASYNNPAFGAYPGLGAGRRSGIPSFRLPRYGGQGNVGLSTGQ